MKVANNNIMSRFEDFIILLLIIVCSYQTIFSNSFNWLDELLIAFIIIIELFFHKFEQIKKSKKSIFIFTIFLLLSMFTIFIRKYSFYAYFSDLLNYFKLIIALSFASFMKIDDDRKNKYMKYFIFVVLISIIFGIYKYYNYTYSPGDMFRNGKWRVSGLSSHPISMGFASLISMIFSLEIEKKKTLDKIIYFSISILSIYTIILTQDRLPLFLMILYFAYKFVIFISKKVKINNNKNPKVFLIVLSSFIGIFIAILGYSDIKNYFNDDINGTIRMFSLQKSGEVMLKYPIFGTGIGSFDCNAAVKNNSYVYEEFGFNRYSSYYSSSETSNNAFESFLAKVIIETGLIGLILHFLYFSRMYKMAINNKNSLLIFFLICTNIYIIFNKAYQIPFIIGISILISHNSFQNKIE